MLTNEEIANASIEDLAKEIELHHGYGHKLYEAMGGKVFRITTTGERSMRDEALNVATYWFDSAHEQAEHLPVNFDFKGYGKALNSFAAIVGATNQDEKNKVLLKTARTNAAKDCATFSSAVRKRMKELEKDPVCKMVLDKEPQPLTPTPTTMQAIRKNRTSKKAAKTTT
jgi:hypothetical protein